MLCWKAFGSPGVIGQVCEGNIPTRRVRVAVAPRRTSGTRPGAAMPGRRGRVALRITRECPADAGWRGHHPGMPGMVDGERLGRVADPPEVPSRRTGLPPCPDRGHGTLAVVGCLVGELRWVGASLGIVDGPGSRVGGSIVRRPPRVAGEALDRSITQGKSRGWPRTPKPIKGAAADPTSAHCSGQMGCCHAECPGHRRTL